MDKTLIRPLEDWMAIPQIVQVLSLSRARVHQLIDEDKFSIEDMRVVGDKRMVLIKHAAVYKQLHFQEERAQRIAADKAEEERRIMGRMITKEVELAIQNEPVVKLTSVPRDHAYNPAEDLAIIPPEED
jgi:hypothetical protein